MMEAAAIALGMAVGGSGEPTESSRVPEHLKGFVPFVQWPDGTQIGRVVGPLYNDLASLFNLTGRTSEWLVKHEKNLLFFVLLSSDMKIQSYILVEFVPLGLEGNDQGEYLFRVQNSVRMYGIPVFDAPKWRWFLLDYLGKDTLENTLALSRVLGMPFLWSKWYFQKILEDPELRRTVTEIETTDVLKDWEWFNGVMLRLSELLEIKHSVPIWHNKRFPIKPETVHMYRWTIGSTDGTRWIMLFEHEDGSARWATAHHARLTKENYFYSEMFKSFYDMVAAHLCAPHGEAAFRDWLARMSEPGEEVGDPDVLEAWELLMDRPAALLSNPDMVALAKSMGDL